MILARPEELQLKCDLTPADLVDMDSSSIVRSDCRYWLDKYSMSTHAIMSNIYLTILFLDSRRSFLNGSNFWNSKMLPSISTGVVLWLLLSLQGPNLRIGLLDWASVGKRSHPPRSTSQSCTNIAILTIAYARSIDELVRTSLLHEQQNSKKKLASSSWMAPSGLISLNPVRKTPSEAEDSKVNPL